jgi:hypothetical protein
VIGAPAALFGRADSSRAITDASGVSYSGQVVDSIEISARNIYDMGDERYRGVLFRSANRLHTVTREQIVRRELLIHRGDRYDPELAKETARNLRSRYPFNDAWIELEGLPNGRLLVRVVTVDQWSLALGVRSLSHDGNQTDFSFGLEERNFLGRAQFVSMDCYVREKYPDYFRGTYREPRIMGLPWAIALEYRSDPLDRLASVYLAKPYYALSQKTEFHLIVAHESTQRRRLDAGGEELAKWMANQNRVETGMGLRYGPAHRKLALSGTYLYSSSSIRDSIRLSDTLSAGVYPLDSTYHRLSLGVMYLGQSFVVERRLEGFGYNEDITLGLRVGMAYGRAFLPDFNRHYYDVVSGEAGYTTRVGHNYLSGTYYRSHWLTPEEEIRRTSSFFLSWYNNSLPFVTWVVKSRFESDRGGYLQRLVLGGKNGLRGFDTDFSSGNRLHVINAEARFYTGLELLSVKLGAALFGDMGRTWLPLQPIALDGYHWNIGVGLRLSLEKLRRGKLIRIDLVRREDAIWEFSFATGQYF